VKKFLSALAPLLLLSACDSSAGPPTSTAADPPDSVQILKVAGHEIPALVQRRNQLVILDFYADWCGACKELQPKLTEVAGEMDCQVVIAKIDIDRARQAMTDFKVRGIPTAVLYLDGRERARLVGNRSQAEIREKIQPIARQIAPVAATPGPPTPAPAPDPQPSPAAEADPAG
jgi:thioredoxin 1